MSKAEQIITELQNHYGVELDPNFEIDCLCDGDTCRHPECPCWGSLTYEVENHLEEKWHKQRLRGSVEVRQLREWLDNCPDQSLPVFIDGKAISEAFFADLESYTITTKEAV